MLQSHLFTKTQKSLPKEEESKNAQLLLRAGFIHKEMAGVYSYLPLGLRVLNKIASIIRDEMNSIGGQELLLTSLQNPAVWQKSNRWSDKVIDNWFKTTLASGKEIGVANTHEEPLTALMKNHIRSYRDLPQAVYQIQTKFRNELRAKSGILRGREFLMKDLYSFSRTEEEFRAFYEECAKAYMRIFERLGIGACTYRTFASGGAFSKFSDEFQTICEAGEDTIYVDSERRLAVNEEVYRDDVLAELKLEKSALQKFKAIEVGNIFPLGTKYAEALQLTYRDEKGQEHPAVMGSYGIGLGRAMGTVVETFADEKGMVWPLSIAPFHVHLMEIDSVKAESKTLYEQLRKQGVEVLYDDRQGITAGEKFADADLFGIPWRMVLSSKTRAKDSVELKARQSGEVQLVGKRELTQFMSANILHSV